MNKGLRRLKIATGYEIVEGVKIPTYKHLTAGFLFLKVYHQMDEMILKLNKTEILLAFFLFRKVSETGIVYNNRITKEEFSKYIASLDNTVNYKSNTIDHAFTKLKQEGVIVSCDKVTGGYWVNPVFMFNHNEYIRNKVLVDIDSQEFNKVNEYINALRKARQESGQEKNIIQTIYE